MRQHRKRLKTKKEESCYQQLSSFEIQIHGRESSKHQPESNIDPCDNIKSIRLSDSSSW